MVYEDGNLQFVKLKLKHFNIIQVKTPIFGPPELLITQDYCLVES